MPLDVHQLPLLNALLNASSTLFLLLGYSRIRRKEVRRHRGFMIAALVCSSLFLVSYIVYHSQVGSIRFTGQGLVRPIYFSILVSHTILATALPVLAALTLTRALKGRFDRHRVIARWTLPLWLYVSATGVIIYLMLYRFYPAP